MNITNTKIQHKRYTQDEWERGIVIEKDKPKLIPYLSQGEIGILLSDDKTQVLQVRIGTDPNGKQKFIDGLLLGNSEIQEDVSCITQYDCEDQKGFPAIGKPNRLYIAKKSNSIYRWNDDDIQYYICSAAPGQGNNWWQEINGGAANLYDNNGNLMLGKSTAISWELPENIEINN